MTRAGVVSAFSRCVEGRWCRCGRRGSGDPGVSARGRCRVRASCTSSRRGSSTGDAADTVGRGCPLVVWPGGPPSSGGTYCLMWSLSLFRDRLSHHGNGQHGFRSTTVSLIRSGTSSASTEARPARSRTGFTVTSARPTQSLIVSTITGPSPSTRPTPTPLVIASSCKCTCRVTLGLRSRADVLGSR